MADDDTTNMRKDAGPSIALDDGTEVSMSELKSGYMMRRDYTRKIETLAVERREMEGRYSITE